MRRVGWSLLLVSACYSSQPLTLPEDPGANSMILVLPTRRAVYGLALPLVGVLPPIELRDDDRLYARTFDRTLEQLGLEQGVPGTFAPGGDSQPVPRGRGNFVTTTGRDRVWQAIETSDADAQFGDVQLPNVGDCCNVTSGGVPGCVFACQLPGRPESPKPPTAPMLPTFDCPAPWTAEAAPLDPDIVRCVPPDLDCPADTWRFPGDVACAPDVCPADGWPVDPPAGAIFVDPAATGVADGSRALPYATLTIAIAQAPDGATLALKAATHQGVVLSRDLKLLGACRTGTLVTSVSARGPVLMISGGTSRIERLSIQSTRFDGALTIGSGASAVLEDVESRSMVDINTRIDGRGTLTAHHVFWRGGTGISAIGGGNAIVSASHIQGTRSRICLELAQSRATLDEVALEACGTDGINVKNGDLHADRVAIDATAVGLNALSSTVTLSHTAILDSATGYLGAGFTRLTADHLWIARMVTNGIEQAGGTISSSDVLIESANGRAVLADATSFDAQRIAIIQPGIFGVSALVGQFSIADLIVRRSAGREANTTIVGASFSGGGTLDRVLVQGNYDLGVSFTGTMTTSDQIHVTDLTVIGVLADLETRNHAVAMSNAKIDFERVAVFDWRGTRFRTGGGVVRVLDFDTDGASQLGLSINQSDVQFDRARIIGHTEAGVSFKDLPTGSRLGSLVLNELEIVDAAGANGVTFQGTAAGTYQASIDRFSIHSLGPPVMGHIAIDIDPVFNVSLKHGVIYDHEIGIQVEESSFPIEQLEDQVYFQGVVESLQDVCLSPPCG